MKRHLRCSFPAAALLLLTPACRDRNDGDAADTDASSDTTAGDAGLADDTGSAALTFWQDVAPVYFDNCVHCHRDGGIAPFPLDTYASAVTWGPASAAAVTQRTMPPWLVTDDGSCGEFLDSRALSDDEVETIAAWVDGGQLEGEPRDDLQAPVVDTLKGTVSYTLPDFVPEIVGGPLAEFDEYRCFLIDDGMDRDTFLTGYDVTPGNEAIVHHVLAVVLDPEAEGTPGLNNRDTVAAYDAESPDRAGWPCFEGAGPETTDKSIPVVWAPGQRPVQYPNDSGVEVAAGDMIVAQVHYNLANPATVGTSDQTQIALRFDDDVQNPGIMLLPDLFLETVFGDEPASLPAGEASAQYSWSIPLGFVLPDFGTDTLDLYGVLPHMHEYGRRIDMRLTGDAGEQCAVDVPAWDFAWQLLYFYEQPIPLTADQVLTVTCDYDTRNAPGPVTPGWGTHNEMCLMGLFVVPR